jgi:nonsense-mediated mRNA decay protein 3
MSPLPCVECGAQAPGLVQGSCPACFTKKTPLLTMPEALDVEVCAHCDARHVGAHWLDPEEGAPLQWTREDAVQAALMVHARVDAPELELVEKQQDEKHFRWTVTVHGTVEGVPVSDQRDTLVRVRKGVCDRCSRMHGGYYSAILQLRATERDVTEDERRVAHKIVREELERARIAGNRMAFLAKDERLPGGHDYYIGDIEGGRQVARLVKDRLGATLIESAKLVGRREGDDVHRVTFLVRIRLFAQGDYGLLDDVPVQVVNIDRGHAIVVDAATHKRTRVDEGRIKRLGGPEILREAVLVSQSPADLQILDPVDHCTKDVPRPEGFVAQGPTVQVLRFEERLYLAVPSSTQSNNP